MTVQEQVRYWGIGIVVFVLAMWYLADALTPFVLGAAIAYLMDPWADWLETHGFGRTWATVIITVFAISVAVLAVVLVIPVLAGQIQAAASAAPEYLEQARAMVRLWLPEVQRQDTFLTQMLDTLRDNVKQWAASMLQQLWSGGIAVVNFLAIALVTPVVSFYLLLDWDRMVHGIDDYLPREHRPTIHRLAGELDRVLSGFVRGQLTVCLILGGFYAIALGVVGLNFGFLIGVFAGLISFIPFVGSVLGGLLSVGVAAAQFWDDPVWIVVVAAIFGIGQLVEGNFLTPWLVGNKVGLHPVWLMFALAAFGALFGFVGLLIAVPAAAAIGVLGRFSLEQYKSGRLYRGTKALAEERDE